MVNGVKFSGDGYTHCEASGIYIVITTMEDVGETHSKNGHTPPVLMIIHMLASAHKDSRVMGSKAVKVLEYHQESFPTFEIDLLRFFLSAFSQCVHLILYMVFFTNMWNTCELEDV